MKIKKASIKGLHKESETPLPKVKHQAWKKTCNKFLKTLLSQWRKEKKEGRLESKQKEITK